MGVTTSTANAGATYVPIQTSTLGSASNSVTLSSIPSTYTDLIIVINHTSSAGLGYFVRVNSDTGSNYSGTYFLGDGSTTQSYRDTSVTLSRAGNAYPTQGNSILQFQNYSNTTTYKTFLSRSGTASNITMACVGLWRSTSAINSVTLLTNSADTFATGSVFTIYGIKAA